MKVFDVASTRRVSINMMLERTFDEETCEKRLESSLKIIADKRDTNPRRCSG